MAVQRDTFIKKYIKAICLFEKVTLKPGECLEDRHKEIG